MRKIITALLAFMLTVTAVCSLASCKNENAPETGWSVQRYVVESDNSDESVVSGEEYLHKLGFNVGDGTKVISEIWVNIPKTKDDSVELSFDVYSSSSTDLVRRTSPVYPTFTRKISKDDVSDAKKNLNSWIKLDFNSNWKDKEVKNTRYVMLTVKGRFDFNEIVFIDEDGKKFSVSLSKIDYYYEDGSIVRNAKSTAQVSDLEDSPLKLIDEQDKFDLRDKK